MRHTNCVAKWAVKNSLDFCYFLGIWIRLQFYAIRLLLFDGGNSFSLQPRWGYLEIISAWVLNEKKYRLQNVLTGYKLLTSSTYARYTRTQTRQNII